jgi:hypothetical protein
MAGLAVYGTIAAAGASCLCVRLMRSQCMKLRLMQPMTVPLALELALWEPNNEQALR